MERPVLHILGSCMARRVSARRAMTLLELAAVVFIVGLVGAMAAVRFGAATVSDVEAERFSQRLALDCLQVRRRAIGLGDNHLLRFTFDGGQATGYAVYRRQGGSLVAVDDTRSVPSAVTVMTSAADIEFGFTGEALSSYTIVVQSAHRSRTITIPQATGKAFLD